MADIYVWIVLAGFMNGLIHGGLCQIEVFRRKRSSHSDEEEHGEEDGGHETSGHSDHSSIINSLFKKYDPTSSPTHGSDEPTIITVNVLVLSMDEINDSKMEYVIDTRLTFSWFDKRLKAENCEEENSECDDRFDMKGRADKMWFPDLYILNARLAMNHDQPLKNGMVYLKGSGDVMLSKRLTLTLRCPMDLTLYPMDTQKCPIIICPYSLTESELKLTWMPNGVSMLEDFQLLQSFMLIPPVMTGQMKWRYDGPDVSGLFSCVNATFQLSRLNGYHIVYSYTVTTFIVMVSWISFWLPVTAVPARVTLGITTLLTLITTANYLRTSLPPIAYVTALDLWVGFCTLFVFASLILYPVSYCRAQKKSLENQAIILKVENTVCPLSSKCKLCGGIKDKLLKLPAKEDNPESGLDKICRTIFPVCFVVLIITYTISFITKTQNAP